MLAGISQQELGRLRMSVGYGRQKKGRPLSPVAVGSLLRRALDSGASLSKCAEAIQLNGTGHIGRFLQILNLPPDLQHLVDWGASNKTIGFSTAVELSRFLSSDQRFVANAILGEGLKTKEVQQARQLRLRSQRPIEECVREIVGMRPIIEKRYVLIGSLNSSVITHALTVLKQEERDSILESALRDIELHCSTGRLGSRFFTLVGGIEFNDSMTKLGKENLEALIRKQISKALEYGQTTR
ncbi:MAG: hypothetical protein OXF03_04305 [Gammaproteobacteria bacterium]|nr:hypothetical protein [Gammaproteobacteria bacterium]